MKKVERMMAILFVKGHHPFTGAGQQALILGHLRGGRVGKVAQHRKTERGVGIAQVVLFQFT